jgi:hypothetical protein
MRELAPRRVAVAVDDATHAVPALAREAERAAWLAVEAHAELDQPLDLARTLLDERAHGLLRAEPRARLERVGRVGVRAVVGRDRGGDPALRPRGVREVELVLRGDDHLAVLRRGERRAQARDARADHERVGEDRRQELRAERNQVAPFGDRGEECVAHGAASPAPESTESLLAAGWSL